MQENKVRKIKRNVIAFLIGTYLLSALGGLMIYKNNSLGGLVFVISPIAMAVFLRLFAGDGWKNAGLKLHVRSNGFLYALSLLAYPLTFLLAVLLGSIGGFTAITIGPEMFLTLLTAGAIAQFIPRMLYALFEEFGWRGYLEPQLSELNIPSLKRHALVGLAWAIWHFPLILATPYTKIPLPIFLPIFTLGLMVASITYGQIRKATQSVWPAVLMHGVANTIAWSILDKQLISFNNKLMVNISPEGLITIVLWTALGVWLMKRQK
jgi:membrane protease YdiL (CAAX protease family)